MSLVASMRANATRLAPASTTRCSSAGRSDPPSAYRPQWRGPLYRGPGGRPTRRRQGADVPGPLARRSRTAGSRIVGSTIHPVSHTAPSTVGAAAGPGGGAFPQLTAPVGLRGSGRCRAQDSNLRLAGMMPGDRIIQGRTLRFGPAGIGISPASRTAWSAWFWSDSCPGHYQTAPDLRIPSKVK
jgi:hypothetical protein